MDVSQISDRDKIEDSSLIEHHAVYIRKWQMAIGNGSRRLYRPCTGRRLLRIVGNYQSQRLEISLHLQCVRNRRTHFKEMRLELSKLK